MTEHSYISVHRVVFHNSWGDCMEPRISHYSSLLIVQRQWCFIAGLPKKLNVCHYRDLHQL